MARRGDGPESRLITFDTAGTYSVTAFVDSLETTLAGENYIGDFTLTTELVSDDHADYLGTTSVLIADGPDQTCLLYTSPSPRD